MDYKSITLKRSSKAGKWERLQLILFDNNGNVRWFNENHNLYLNEIELVRRKQVVNRFLERYAEFKHLEPAILQGFKQLQGNDLSGNTQESMDISVVSAENPRSYYLIM